MFVRLVTPGGNSDLFCKSFTISPGTKTLRLWSEEAKNLISLQSENLTFELVGLKVYLLPSSGRPSHLDIRHVDRGEEPHLHHPRS